MESNRPQNELRANDLLAEETHASRIWCLLIAPAFIMPVISVFFYATTPAMIALLFVAVIGLGALALTWSGFQYRFLRNAVEIRTLGYTLRTIPKEQIMSYSIESWSLPRGYGIRGIGSTRAYVWGNKVVHIKTTNGDVYLGHNDPQRIVRDLDRVMGYVSTDASLQPTARSH
jgi:hypothetical protein